MTEAIADDLPELKIMVEGLRNLSEWTVQNANANLFVRFVVKCEHEDPSER